MLMLCIALDMMRSDLNISGPVMTRYPDEELKGALTRLHYSWALATGKDRYDSTSMPKLRDENSTEQVESMEQVDSEMIL